MNHVHVEVVKNTNNVVESSKSPVITGFFRAPNTSEYTLDTFLDTFRWVSKRYLDTQKWGKNTKKLYGKKLQYFLYL